MSDKSLDALIEELKESSKTEAPKQTETVTEENMSQFIMDKTAELVNSGITSVKELKEAIMQTSGVVPEEVEAYAKLIGATSQAIEIFNKIGLQDKKIKAAKELKQMDVESKGSLPASGNTNVVICTREEVLERILKDAQKKIDYDVVEAEVLEETPQLT